MASPDSEFVESRDFMLISPLSLRPTEETLQARVNEIVAMVLNLEAWTHPICVERTVHALLDGHHRLAASKELGLTVIPVLLFDYSEVHLSSWRSDLFPSRAEVLRRALTGDLYPYKTTRHTFPARNFQPIPLAELRQSQPIDRSRFRVRNSGSSNNHAALGEAEVDVASVPGL